MRARRIAEISWSAVAKASINARRSAAETPGRRRKSTTCAINGAGPSGIDRAAGTDAATGGVPARPVPEEERSVPLDAEAASVVAFHSGLARGPVREASVAAVVRPCPAPGPAGDRDPMVAG